jgi:hypothetical protein
MPGAIAWLEGGVPWRNQFLFNLALARLDCGIELDQTFNVQLHAVHVDLTTPAGRPRAEWHGRPVRILHANGHGRDRYARLRGLYSIADPPVGAEPDAYSAFAAALQAWQGRHGHDRANGLALLHHLVRESGCTTVLDSGAARGVPAACSASAVWGRPDARVVTFAPPSVARDELWASLPQSACIEARELDAWEALRETGERFDACVLDRPEQLELAAGLVRPGGPVLVRGLDAPRPGLARLGELGLALP